MQSLTVPPLFQHFYVYSAILVVDLGVPCLCGGFVKAPGGLVSARIQNSVKVPALLTLDSSPHLIEDSNLHGQSGIERIVASLFAYKYLTKSYTDILAQHSFTIALQSSILRKHNWTWLRDIVQWN
ncbi:hypothetical protein KIN20_005659 [Parelaphostrongylus tenuis]|uniref:Uncharacterized protein n=1 Tax=Parelaphostrongylus tenuis TaxID=148309 RepID=A0AAD5QHP1_PARTN|nr:hypothetical protein KIN20_005659 [Parelaphostrongylus tenuis]